MKFPESFTILSDEVSQELPEVTRFLREFGLPGFELRSMFGRAFKDLTDADLRVIRTVAQTEGWRIYGCASPVFKCGLDDSSAIQEHVELFKRSIDAAVTLQSGMVRIFTFLRGPGILDHSTLQRVAGHLTRLIELAAGSGVRLGIENEHSCSIATADEVAALVAVVPNDQLGIIWDPCNMLYLRARSAPTGEDFVKLARRIIHIHIKDAIRRENSSSKLSAESVPVGIGDVGWRSHLAAIEASGYRGMLSLETHWRLHHLDEAALHLPAGFSFSKGGEEASRTCLRNIQGLLGVGS